MDNLDEHLIPRTPFPTEMADFAWWEARRPYYNFFLVGMIGLMLWQLFPMARNYGWPETIFWSVVYVVFANVFYCLGYLLPLLLKYYVKTDFGLPGMASILFNLGVIASFLFTSIVYMWWLLPFRG
ncbi:MAG: hypothetical protein ACI81P_001506 [Neolewinella sp.]|jgi:hypothetical protein